MLRIEIIFLILLTLISVTSLVISITCLVKKEKYDVLVTENDNLGLQNLDLVTRDDLEAAVKTINADLEAAVNKINDDLQANYIKYTDQITLATSIGGIGSPGCETTLNVDDQCNLVTQASGTYTNNWWEVKKA